MFELSMNSLPVEDINRVFSPASGEMKEGGVLFFDMPRTDLKPVLFGVAMQPANGFDAEIGFQPIEGGAFVKWEFCLLDTEVNSLMSRLYDAALTPAANIVTALHNHYLQLNPEIKFLHGGAKGDPVEIAKTLRGALESHTGQPFRPKQQNDNGSPNELPTDEIVAIIGGTKDVSGKILTVGVDRKETIRELDVVLQPPNHIHSEFGFQLLNSSEAAVRVEFILLPTEVDAVARSLKAGGFNVTAVHNHELFVEPQVFYLHAFHVGPPISLAKAIREALNRTNSKVSS